MMNESKKRYLKGNNSRNTTNNLSIIAKTSTAGITLISLVVTIIVLIILAGISINLVLGENGIITKAKEANKLQDITSIKEEIKLKILAKETEKKSKGESIGQSEIEKILEPEYGIVNKNEDGTIKSLITKDKNYEIPFEQIYSGKINDIKQPVDVSKLEKGIFVEYDVEYTDVYYSNYKYTTTNGWRLIDYKTRDDGKTLYDVKLISTGIPVEMYYCDVDTTNNYEKWVTDSTKLTQFKTILGNDYNYYTGSEKYTGLEATAGFYYNLGEMKFTKRITNYEKNMGYYATVKNKNVEYTEGEQTGNNLFKARSDASIRMLTLPELNKALGRTNISNIEAISDATGIYQLKQLKSILKEKDYEASYGFTSYWLASPWPASESGVCFVHYDGYVGQSGYDYKGVRPVISLSSDVQLIQEIDESGFVYYSIME